MKFQFIAGQWSEFLGGILDHGQKEAIPGQQTARHKGEHPSRKVTPHGRVMVVKEHHAWQGSQDAQAGQPHEKQGKYRSSGQFHSGWIRVG